MKQNLSFPTLEALEARIPKDQVFDCYVCGHGEVTYRHLLTIPPDPSTILMPPECRPISENIIPVATCGRPYCEGMERRRQDAIFLILVAPIREQFLAERTARVAKARGEARRHQTEE